MRANKQLSDKIYYYEQMKMKIFLNEIVLACCRKKLKHLASLARSLLDNIRHHYNLSEFNNLLNCIKQEMQKRSRGPGRSRFEFSWLNRSRYKQYIKLHFYVSASCCQRDSLARVKGVRQWKKRSKGNSRDGIKLIRKLGGGERRGEEKESFR